VLRIKKKHVGVSVDFLGCNRAAGITQTGTVTEVVNGFATLEVAYFETQEPGGYRKRERTPNGEPWRMLLPVRDPRIVKIWE
jgi:hypothetical protein